MKRKKIFFIDPQSMRNLSIYDYGVLSEIKSEVIYICSKYYDYLPMEENITFKKIFSYNYIKNPICKVASYLLSYIIVFFLIVKTRPSIIHIQWFRIPVFDYLFFLLVKIIFKPKLIYTAHNILPHNTGTRYRRVFNKIYRLFDSIIVHSQKTKQEMASLFHIPEYNIFVNNHGIIKMEYDKNKLKDMESYYSQKYALNGKIVFTSLGEQSHYKAIDLLAEVWEKTPELNNNDKIRLLLIGKQNNIDLSKIKNIENVIIDNRKISNEEFIYLLHHTDVYILPYRTISQSGALFTALAEHVPVLVSDAGGLAEPLSVAKIGWCVKSNDFEALKQKLQYLASNKEEIIEVKKNIKNWNKVCELYDWHNISKRMADIYKQTVNNQRILIHD